MADSALGHAASPTVASAFRASTSRDNNAKAALISTKTVTTAKANSSNVRLLANNASLGVGASSKTPSVAGTATKTPTACKKKKNKNDTVLSTSKVTNKTTATSFSSCKTKAAAAAATLSPRHIEMIDLTSSPRAHGLVEKPISNRRLKREPEDYGYVEEDDQRRRANVSDEKKRRRSDRYDSSESSDSGVASLVCSDASSWSSSSDITEPVSPASPLSSQPSPLSQPPLEASVSTTNATSSISTINPYHNNNNNNSSSSSNPPNAASSDIVIRGSVGIRVPSSLHLVNSSFCSSSAAQAMIFTSTPLDGQNPILTFPECPNSLKKRRRYSESSTSTETQLCQSKDEGGNDSGNSSNNCCKRPRRMSSQQPDAKSQTDTPINKKETNTDKARLEGSPASLLNKMFGFLKWPSRSNGTVAVVSDKDDGGGDDDIVNCHSSSRNSKTNQHHNRLSWPMSNQQHQQPNGQQQLKITEFFPAQVKHSWSYSKLPSGDLRELKELHQSVDSINLKERLAAASESRVAIVSVAHVDHHVDTNFNLQTPTSGASVTTTRGEEKSESHRIPIAAGPPDFIPVVTTPQIRFPALNPPSGNSNRNHLKFNTAIASGSATWSASSSSSTVPNSSTPATSDVVHEDRCLWQHCTASLAPGQSLLEHIHSAHVASQSAASTAGASSSSSLTSSSSSNASRSSNSSPVPAVESELYVCQWEGCKYQGKTSSSRAWLEQHVLSHCGNKPYSCIFCEQRFKTQTALERHVNAHLKEKTIAGSNGLKRDNALAKIMRRNAKKQKNRRSKAAPAKLMDYFDAGIMERLRHQLVNSEESQKQLGFSCLGSSSSPCLIVHSQILARRLDTNGKRKVLVRWMPQDLELPDQWMLDSEVVKCKTVPLHDLSNDAQIRLNHIIHQPSASATSSLSGSAAAPRAPKQRRK